jgi:hypothetical protein
MMKLLACASAAAAINLCASLAAQASPTLLVEAGKVIGADNVQVAGALYDVRFVDGTCTQVFGVCSTASFAFDYNNAVQAALALLDTVLVDTDPKWPLDSRPSLIRGCGDPYERCEIFTPAFFEVQLGVELLTGAVASAQPRPSQYSDQVVGESRTLDTDTSPYWYETWAVWTKAPANQLPDPPSISLVGAALGLAYVSHLSRRRTSPRANAD